MAACTSEREFDLGDSKKLLVRCHSDEGHKEPHTGAYFVAQDGPYGQSVTQTVHWQEPRKKYTGPLRTKTRSQAAREVWG